MKNLLCVLLILSPFAAQARPAAIDAYVAELARVEQAPAPVSLQKIFALMDEVQADVMQLDGSKAWLETLTDAEYDQLKSELRGFILNRGYDIYAQADPQFLLTLAEARGDEADREFFRRYHQYWSASYTPVFLRQTDRPSPCVRFGERILPEVYESWGAYARRYPKTFLGFAEQVVRDVEEIMELGTCACADEASVSQELTQFLRRYPQTPVASKIRARLKQLREDPDQRPVRCL